MKHRVKIPPRLKYHVKESKIPLKTQQRLIYLILALFLGVFLVVMVNLVFETGIFQESKINNRDLAHWEYDSSGNILGAQGFALTGSQNTCWLLVHSYTASPAEMRELAAAIHLDLDHRVEVPLLEGHGSVPSSLLDKNLDIWYAQMEIHLEEMQESCNNINVVGSSISSPLVLRLAEEHKLNKIFVLNSFIKLTYSPHHIFPLRPYIMFLTPATHYYKKSKIAQIRDPIGREKHIAYWNMPYQPIRDSFNFIDHTEANLNKISEPIFIAHSPTDPTADKKSAEIIHQNVKSKAKKLIWYENSGHVLLLDYNKKDLIKDII